MQTTADPLPRVEIHRGTIRTTVDAPSRHLVEPVYDKPMFFVDAFADDGWSACFWQGESYEQAILRAHELSRDFGTVIDRVV